MFHRSPVFHRWTTAVATADFAVATGGGTHSPTGGPPEIPLVVTDCSTDGTSVTVRSRTGMRL